MLVNACRSNSAADNTYATFYHKIVIFFFRDGNLKGCCPHGPQGCLQFHAAPSHTAPSVGCPHSQLTWVQ